MLEGLRSSLQGHVQPGDLVEGPQVWSRADVDRTSSDWTTYLTEAHVAELEAAVHAILEGGRARIEGNYVQLVSTLSTHIPVIG